MGMRQNWDLFIQTTKAKSKAHVKSARDWDRIHTVLSLSLIFLGAVTTFCALMKSVPSLVVAGIAGLATLVSAVSAFLRPGDHRQTQVEASREFKTLMMKMVRCETEREYEELWGDYNKAIMDEPFLPKKYVSGVDIEWTMSPELTILIKRKEDEVEEVLNEDAAHEAHGGMANNDANGILMVDINSPNKNNEVTEKTRLLPK